MIAVPTAAQNIPLPGVRGKYGKQVKQVTSHFCQMQFCGVVGFTLFDAMTNFS